MNEDLNSKKEETLESEAPPSTDGSGNSFNESKEPKKRRHHTAAFLFCAVTFLVVYIIVNFPNISGIFSGLISVLSPIILGFALAYVLNPLLRLFEFRIFKGIKNKKLLRAISLIMTYVVTILVLTAFFLLVIPELINSISRFGSKFGDQIVNYIERGIAWANNFIASILGSAGSISKEDLLKAITNVQNAASESSGSPVTTIIEFIIQYGTVILIGIKNFIVALFISVYVLISKERIGAQINKGTSAFLSKKAKATLYRYARICNKAFSGFFTGVIIDSVLIGFITLAVLSIFKVPFATLVATIVAITNIIPVFGPFIGAIPSFFIILIESPTKAFLFLLLLLLIQQLDGNVIAPKILGTSTGLSSLGVIISITVMGEFFGLIGMLLGVPIFAVGVTLINEFTENKLRKKNMPANTAEYYAQDSLVDPYQKHDTLFHKAYVGIKNISKKISKSRKEKKADSDGDGNTEEKEDK